MSFANRVVRNTIIQIVGRVIGLMVVLVTVNYIANHLVVDGSALKGYGQYSIVFAYVSIIGSLADMGLFTLVVREITNQPKEIAGRIIGNAIGFRLILLLATFILLGVIYPFLPYDPVVKQGIAMGVVVAFSMLLSQAIATIFQANLVTSRIVVAETIGKVIIAALTIFVLSNGGGLSAVILANLAGNVVTLVISYLLARSLVTIPIGFNFKLWREKSGQFWSMALITVLGLIHFKFDSIMLSLFKGAADVGLYSIAYKILEIILIIPSIFATNLLPVMTAIVDQGNQDELGGLVKRSASVFLAIALYISVVVFLLASWIIVFITQSEFIAAASALRVLVLAVLFIFMTTLMAQAIISTRQQKVLLRGYVMVVVLNIVLNLIAIPRWSYMGAAWTTFITEGVLMTYTVIVAWKQFGARFDWVTLARLATASIFSLLILWGIRGYLVSRLSDFMVMSKGQQTLELILALFVSSAVFYLLTKVVFVGSKTQLRSLVSWS